MRQILSVVKPRKAAHRFSHPFSWARAAAAPRPASPMDLTMQYVLGNAPRFSSVEENSCREPTQELGVDDADGDGGSGPDEVRSSSSPAVVVQRESPAMWLEALGTVQRRGPSASTANFNAVIALCARARLWRQMHCTHQLLVQHANATPDSDTYQVLLFAALQRADWEVALTHVDQLRRDVLVPSPATARLAMRAFAVAGADHWQRALRAFQWLRPSLSDAASLEAILDTLITAGRYSEVMRVYDACRTSIPSSPGSLGSVIFAARQLGAWATALRLGGSIMDSGMPDTVAAPLMEDALICASAAGQHRHVLTFFEHLGSTSDVMAHLTGSAFSAIARSAVAENAYAAALAALHFSERHLPAVPADVYSALMVLADHAGAPDQQQRVLELVSRRGIDPADAAHCALLYSSADWRRSLRVLANIREPDALAVTLALRSVASTDRWREAAAVVALAVSAGSEVRTLPAWQRRGWQPTTAAAIVENPHAGKPPDPAATLRGHHRMVSVSYQFAADALTSQPLLTVALLQLMKEAHVKPTTATARRGADAAQALGSADVAQLVAREVQLNTSVAPEDFVAHCASLHRLQHEPQLSTMVAMLRHSSPHVLPSMMNIVLSRIHTLAGAGASDEWIGSLGAVADVGLAAAAAPSQLTYRIMHMILGALRAHRALTGKCATSQSPEVEEQTIISLIDWLLPLTPTTWHRELHVNQVFHALLSLLTSCGRSSERSTGRLRNLFEATVLAACGSPSIVCTAAACAARAGLVKEAALACADVWHLVGPDEHDAWLCAAQVAEAACDLPLAERLLSHRCSSTSAAAATMVDRLVSLFWRQDDNVLMTRKALMWQVRFAHEKLRDEHITMFVRRTAKFPEQLRSDVIALPMLPGGASVMRRIVAACAHDQHYRSTAARMRMAMAAEGLIDSASPFAHSHEVVVASKPRWYGALKCFIEPAQLARKTPPTIACMLFNVLTDRQVSHAAAASSALQSKVVGRVLDVTESVPGAVPRLWALIAAQRAAPAPRGCLLWHVAAALLVTEDIQARWLDALTFYRLWSETDSISMIALLNKVSAPQSARMALLEMIMNESPNSSVMETLIEYVGMDCTMDFLQQQSQSRAATLFAEALLRNLVKKASWQRAVAVAFSHRNHPYARESSDLLERALLLAVECGHWMTAVSFFASVQCAPFWWGGSILRIACRRGSSATSSLQLEEVGMHGTVISDNCPAGDSSRPRSVVFRESFAAQRAVAHLRRSKHSEAYAFFCDASPLHITVEEKKGGLINSGPAASLLRSLNCRVREYRASGHSRAVLQFSDVSHVSRATEVIASCDRLRVVPFPQVFGATGVLADEWAFKILVRCVPQLLLLTTCSTKEKLHLLFHLASTLPEVPRSAERVLAVLDDMLVNACASSSHWRSLWTFFSSSQCPMRQASERYGLLLLAAVPPVCAVDAAAVVQWAVGASGSEAAKGLQHAHLTATAVLPHALREVHPLKKLLFSMHLQHEGLLDALNPAGFVRKMSEEILITPIAQRAIHAARFAQGERTSGVAEGSQESRERLRRMLVGACTSPDATPVSALATLRKCVEAGLPVSRSTIPANLPVLVASGANWAACAEALALCGPSRVTHRACVVQQQLSHDYLTLRRSVFGVNSSSWVHASQCFALSTFGLQRGASKPLMRVKHLQEILRHSASKWNVAAEIYSQFAASCGSRVLPNTPFEPNLYRSLLVAARLSRGTLPPAVVIDALLDALRDRELSHGAREAILFDLQQCRTSPEYFLQVSARLRGVKL